MIKLIVACEGPTEVTFVKRVMAPILTEHGVSAYEPYDMEGALNLDRVKDRLTRILRGSAKAYVTTLFDLYALGPTFRGVNESKGQEPSVRSKYIESLLYRDVVEHAKCDRPERFIAYIQPHEFEALLFSSVTDLCAIDPEWGKFVGKLESIRENVETPEHINDSWETAPSKRLEILEPRYRKTRHGPVGAQRIGLDKIREECPHFRQWFNRLTTLQPL